MNNGSWCVCVPGGNPFTRGGPGRRQALRATGVGFVATLTSILVGAGRTAQAEPVAGGPPVVDGVSVRILADNHTDRYSIPFATPGMKVERVTTRRLIRNWKTRIHDHNIDFSGEVSVDLPIMTFVGTELRRQKLIQESKY